MQKKILTAAAEKHSYGRAALVLDALAEVEISSRQINRITDTAGERLREQQQQHVVGLQNKTLKVEVSNTPDLAVVEFDAGRIRTRETGTHNPA